MRRLDRPLFLRKALAQGADPYFTSVALLLHMDGVNTGTTFIDSSSNNFAVSQFQATTSATQSKFGPTAGFFNGNHYILVPHASALDLTTGDWTIEGWLYIATLGANSLVIQKATNTGFYPWQLYYTASGNLNFRAFDTGTSLLFTIAAATGLTAGGWHHWAMTRNGNTFTLWVDGVSAGTATSANDLYSNVADPVILGMTGNGALAMIGYQDDVRITKGVARYTAGFLVPTQEFPNS